jgi:hypothetical protein
MAGATAVVPRVATDPIACSVNLLFDWTKVSICFADQKGFHTNTPIRNLNWDGW